MEDVNDALEWAGRAIGSVIVSVCGGYVKASSEILRGSRTPLLRMTLFAETVIHNRSAAILLARECINRVGHDADNVVWMGRMISAAILLRCDSDPDRDSELPGAKDFFGIMRGSADLFRDLSSPDILQLVQYVCGKTRATGEPQ